MMGLFLHTSFLQAFDLLCPYSSQNTSCQSQVFSGNPLIDFAACNRPFIFKAAYIQLHHLSDFFFQGHIL